MHKIVTSGMIALGALILMSRVSPSVGGQASQTTQSSPQLPRTADGKPDLNGIWQVLTPAAWDIQDHHAALGMPAGQGIVEGNEIPYQPWALAKRRENFENRLTADPARKCYLPGVPRATYMPFPFEIVQTGSHVAILYEYLHATRTIYMDGRQRRRGLPEFWMGDSRGRWEGDALVVDVANFNDQTWFDRAGNFHSSALHVIERYTPMDANLIVYEATIEDPKVFTRPWKISVPLYRRREKDVQLLEYECYGYLEDEYLAERTKKAR